MPAPILNRPPAPTSTVVPGPRTIGPNVSNVPSAATRNVVGARDISCGEGLDSRRPKVRRPPRRTMAPAATMNSAFESALINGSAYQRLPALAERTALRIGLGDDLVSSNQLPPARRTRRNRPGAWASLTVWRHTPQQAGRLARRESARRQPVPFSNQLYLGSRRFRLHVIRRGWGLRVSGFLAPSSAAPRFFNGAETVATPVCGDTLIETTMSSFFVPRPAHWTAARFAKSLAGRPRGREANPR